MEKEDRVGVEKATATEKEAHVSAEEKLEEVNISNDLQKLRPILISSKLTKEEKTSLIQLLREFRDVFAWEYGEIPSLDPNLVVHTLNVEPGTKPVAQLVRVFHTNIEA